MAYDPTIFRPYSSYSAEEEAAVLEVMRSGSLSHFIVAWDDKFYGGPRVRQLEDDFCKYFSVRHAIAVNSWTSGLSAAVGSLRLEPGDEIIVTPWTMSASVAAILHWNAIPVFADIDPQTYCLDPKAVEAAISPNTRAIMSVDIFGQSADVQALNTIAEKHCLKVISDTAQAPGALVGGRYAGTLSNVGGYSLNYHKHIHTGEGGVIVTDDDEVAEACRMIRNHAEAVVAQRPGFSLVNMIGHNFRMGELEAALGSAQLSKLDRQVRSRQDVAASLNSSLSRLPGLSVPFVSPGNTHVYYVYPLQIDLDVIPWDKQAIASRLESLGIPGIATRYTNLHLLPAFQNKIAFGSRGFPWVTSIARRSIDYRKGICPAAEKLQDFTYLAFAICQFEMQPKAVETLVEAFELVWQEMGLV